MMMKYEIGWHSGDQGVCHVASIDDGERDELFDVQLYDPDVPEGDTNARQKSLDALQKLVDDANDALLLDRAGIKQALEGDSNDAEHDELAGVADALGITWISPFDDLGADDGDDR